MYFLVDESGFDEKSKALIVALLILDELDSIRMGIERLKEEILHDPNLKTIPALKTKLEKEGFHYCEDHVEVRNLFIELIPRLGFQAYICFAEKRSGDERNYREWYKNLFGRLLFDRIRDNWHENIHIIYEKNTEKEQNIIDLIKRVIVDINKSHKKKVSSAPKIICSGKTEPSLSLVDYVCGIFKGHYENLDKSGNLERRNFDRIRGKVRVIHNFLTDEFYTRKNLFP